jgi:threonine dehydrogenase-like Zn-dependent dehydrogenase
MKSLWLENQKLSFRDDAPIPVPRAGEALVRVSLAGICSTDLELLRGYYPFTGIPGHEFVGVVVSSPSDKAWMGKRVVGEINIACGECDTCQAGIPSHCENRKTLGIQGWDGGFAEYLVLPISNLHLVPAALPDKLAVFTEPLAAACEILEQVRLSSQQRVLLIGAGRLGQLVAQVLHQAGCQLEVVIRHLNQHALLAQRNITTLTEQTVGLKKYDLVVEASGTPSGFTLARKCVRPRGTIVLKSTYQGSQEVNLSSIVVDEVSLVGSRCGPFAPALKLLSAGKVDPLPMVEAVYPIDQGLTAFEHATQPGVLKILLQP